MFDPWEYFGAKQGYSQVNWDAVITPGSPQIYLGTGKPEPNSPIYVQESITEMDGEVLYSE